MRVSFVQGTISSQSSGGAGTGTFAHGTAFTIVGSGFGTYTTRVWLTDYGQDGVGGFNSGWHSRQLDNSFSGDSPYFMCNRAVGTSPTGANIGQPHPFVQSLLSGAHYSTNPANVNTGVTATIMASVAGLLPPFPFTFYRCWYMLEDPNFDLLHWGESTHDYNIKHSCYGSKFGTQFAQIIVDTNDLSNPWNHTDVVRQLQQLNNGNGTTDGGQAFQYQNGGNPNPGGSTPKPGNNAYSPNSAQFWGNGLNVFNPSNGWVFHEEEVCMDQRTWQAGGVGYQNYWQNCAAGGVGPRNTLINYVGQTDECTNSPFRQFTVGNTFCRAYGPGFNNNTFAQTNYVWMADNRFMLSGPNVTQVARVIAGDQPTHDASFKRVPQDVVSWLNGQILIRFWQGNLPPGTTCYLHALLENGTILNNVASGTIGVGFDFFISPTGSSTNPGTLAAPWDLGSLASKSSTYAGKRLGIIGAGPTASTPDYDVSAANNTPRNFNNPLFAIPAGISASAPTYIAACDISGNYLQRGAWISAKLASPNSAGTRYTGSDGSLTSVPNEGGIIGNISASGCSYIVIDGLRLSGVRSTPICLGSVGAIGSYGNFGCVVMNCEIFDCNDTVFGVAGGNYSSVQPFNQVGFVFHNNYVHDMLAYSATNCSANSGHLAAFMTWYCKDTLIQYNTCRNAGGFYGKEAYSQGTIIRFNHVDDAGITFGEGVTNFTGNNDTTSNAIGLIDTTQIYNNVFNVYADGLRLHPNLHWGAGQGWATPLQIYNNTIIWSHTNVCGFEMFAMPGTTAVGGLQFYNNILCGPAQTQDGNVVLNPAAPGVVGYNVTQTQEWLFTANSSGSVPSGQGSGTGSTRATTLASAQSSYTTLGGTGPFETNTVVTAQTLAQLFSQTGTSAQKYQLIAGSAGLSAGSTTGTSAGTPVDAGAYGGVVPPGPTGIGSKLNGVLD